MQEYVVTTHAHLPGVGLMKRGHWGGLRYDDDATAVAAIEADAKGAPYTIKRQKFDMHLPVFKPA